MAGVKDSARPRRSKPPGGSGRYTGDVPLSFHRRVTDGPDGAAPGMRVVAMIVRATLVLMVISTLAAADRTWQTGTWGDITTKRQIVDFGPGASGFGRPTSTPPMRAMADRRHFVIETDTLRIEAEDTVSIGRRTFDAVSGERVTFAIDKSAVYVRDGDGTEHKLRLVKKVERRKTD